MSNRNTVNNIGGNIKEKTKNIITNIISESKKTNPILILLICLFITFIILTLYLLTGDLNLMYNYFQTENATLLGSIIGLLIAIVVTFTQIGSIKVENNEPINFSTIFKKFGINTIVICGAGAIIGAILGAGITQQKSFNLIGNIRNNLTIALLIIGTFISILMVSLASQSDNQNNTYNNIDENTKIFEKIYNYFKSNYNSFIILTAIIMSLSIFLPTYNYYYKFNPSFFSGLQSLTLYLLLFIVIGTAFYRYIYSNKNVYKYFEGPTTTIYRLFISIICIFNDTIKNIYNDYQITPKSSFFVIAIIILFFSIYYLYPYLQKLYLDLLTHDGIELIKEPIYLDNEIDMGLFNKINKINENIDHETRNKQAEELANQYAFEYGIEINSEEWETIKKDYLDEIPDTRDNADMTYSISSWIYINDQEGNEYKNILNMGSKPIVKYNPNGNMLQVSILKDDDSTPVIFKTNELKKQKWNFIVFNFNGGTIDIFINGNLISSIDSTDEDKPLYSSKNGYLISSNDSTDEDIENAKIIFGNENGIQGGINKVVYYQHPLTMNMIKTLYSFDKNMSFPRL